MQLKNTQYLVFEIEYSLLYINDFRKRKFSLVVRIS